MFWFKIFSTNAAPVLGPIQTLQSKIIPEEKEIERLTKEANAARPTLSQRAKDAPEKSYLAIASGLEAPAPEDSRGLLSCCFPKRTPPAFEIEANTTVITEAVLQRVKEGHNKPTKAFVQLMTRLGFTIENAYEQFKAQASALTGLQAQRAPLAYAVEGEEFKALKSKDLTRKHNASQDRSNPRFQTLNQGVQILNDQITTAETEMMQAWVIYDSLKRFQKTDTQLFKTVFSGKDFSVRVTPPGQGDTHIIKVPLLQNFESMRNDKRNEAVRNFADMIRGFSISYARPALTPQHLAMQPHLNLTGNICYPEHKDWALQEQRLVAFIRTLILPKDQAVRKNAVEFLKDVATELNATRSLSAYISIWAAVLTPETPGTQQTPLFAANFPGEAFFTAMNDSTVRITNHADAVPELGDCTAMEVYCERAKNRCTPLNVTFAALCRSSEDLELFCQNSRFKRAVEDSLPKTDFETFTKLLQASQSLLKARMNTQDAEQLKESAGIGTMYGGSSIAPTTVAPSSVASFSSLGSRGTTSRRPAPSSLGPINEGSSSNSSSGKRTAINFTGVKSSLV